MTNPPDEPIEDESAAIAFCHERLARKPTSSYRDVRREARDKGIKVTRAVFTQVQRETGNAPPEPAEWKDPDAGHRDDERASGASGATVGREPQPQRSEGRDRWQGLFSDDASAESETTPPSAEEPSQPSAAETPTESARRALGLLSPPAAADEPRQNAVEFMANFLREKPEASYREVREAAEANGYTVSSATFGRAQHIVGILEDDEPAKPAEPAAEKDDIRKSLKARARRGRDPAALLEEFIVHFQEANDDSSRWRQALEQMLQVVEHALEQESTERPS